ncbi:MAG: CRISPR-associated endonuclease Cas2 [Dokdonella sp.]|nr:MAG: CRISPR-associated endonuclease Cas2 [Dokdonella sp.]
MWMLVMFDLPVDTDENRKAANDFRRDLLDFGFERCQYSVYLRFCEGREQADTWTRRVHSVLPGGGRVYCLYFTDKQYEGIVRFERRQRQKRGQNPDQYQLF